MTSDKNQHDKNKDTNQKRNAHNQHNNYVLQCLDDREMGVDFYQRFIADYAKGTFVAETVTPCKGHYVSVTQTYPRARS